MNNEYNIKREAILATANNLRWEVGENMHDTLMESIYENATAISNKAIVYPDKKPAFSFDRTLDKKYHHVYSVVNLFHQFLCSL